MTREFLRLRACYWAGAVLDAFMVVAMVVPSVGARLFGLEDFRPPVEYRYAMFIGAALMAGWTALLVWASRRPVERKAVLLLTVPVVIGMAAAGAFAVREGFIAPGRMAPVWVVQAVLIAAFAHAYFTDSTSFEREVRT